MATTSPTADAEQAAPRDLQSLLKLIEGRGAEMSPQFHQIARYVIANPDEVALAPVRVLAQHIGAHPSTIVRFAKLLNYAGFKEMQLVFKASMYARAQGVNSRISRLDQQLAAKGRSKTDDGVRNIIAAEITSLQTLLENLSIADLDQAVKLIGSARIVWVVTDLDGGAVGAHLARMLAQLPRDARLLEAGSQRSQEAIRLAKAGDVVVSIELASDRTMERPAEVGIAAGAGCKVISIANDPRLTDDAHVTFSTATSTALAPTLASPLTLVHILALQVANRAHPGRYRLPEMAEFDPLGW